MEKEKLERILDYAYRLGMSQIRDEITKLAKLLIKKKPKNVLEIGSKLGGNFYLLCRICDGKRISVDLEEGEHGGWILQHHPYLGDITYLRNKYFKSLNSIMIMGNSHHNKTLNKVKDELKNQKLDVLYIDGDHTYKGVEKDFEMYSPLVKHNGLIIFHDINDTEFHKKANNQVCKFWKELKGNKIEISIKEHWGGIGILCL